MDFQNRMAVKHGGGLRRFRSGLGWLGSVKTLFRPGTSSHWRRCAWPSVAWTALRQAWVALLADRNLDPDLDGNMWGNRNTTPHLRLSWLASSVASLLTRTSCSSPSLWTPQAWPNTPHYIKCQKLQATPTGREVYYVKHRVARSMAFADWNSNRHTTACTRFHMWLLRAFPLSVMCCETMRAEEGFETELTRALDICHMVLLRNGLVKNLPRILLGASSPDRGRPSSLHRSWLSSGVKSVKFHQKENAPLNLFQQKPALPNAFRFI